VADSERWRVLPVRGSMRLRWQGIHSLVGDLPRMRQSSNGAASSELDVGDGREAAVDVRVGPDDFDLESGHAALADLLQGVRDPVHRAHAVGDERHPRRLRPTATRTV